MKSFKEHLSEWFFAWIIVISWIGTSVGLLDAIKQRGIGSGDAAGWAQVICAGANLVLTFVIFLISINIQKLAVRYQKAENDRQKTEAEQQKVEIEHQRDVLKAGILLVGNRLYRLIASIEKGTIYKSLASTSLKQHIQSSYVTHIDMEIKSIQSILARVSLDKLAEAGAVESVLYLDQALNGLHTLISTGLSIEVNSGTPTNGANIQQFKNLTKLAQQKLKSGPITIVDYDDLGQDAGA